MKALAATVLVAAMTVGGAAWADPIDGTAGDDVLHGTLGDDVITAKAGDDIVKAGGGDDLVLAGPGKDQVSGGKGADELRGGKGADTLNASRDRKKDYVVAEGGADKLYLFGADNGYGGPGDDRIWATYAVAGMRVNCGPGHDVLIFNQPSPAVVRLHCEVVKVKSAG